MLQAGADTIVMGCTHYPFVIPLIQEIAGPGVRVIDPAPAVARQAGRLLSARGWVSAQPMPGWMQFFTSGDPGLFTRLLPLLLGETGEVTPILWEDARIK
jgi:glutamate racemase